MSFMDSLFPILIGIAAACAVVALILILASSQNGQQKKQKQKSRGSIIRTAEKKLAQDPYDPAALLPLSELYYKEQQWEKAFPLFVTLAEIIPTHPEIDMFETALRDGICSVKLGKLSDALKSLSLARREKPDSFETNFYLGQAFFLNKDYDKAIPCFKKALSLGKEAPEAFEYLGLSLYRIRLFREALP